MEFWIGIGYVDAKKFSSDKSSLFWVSALVDAKISTFTGWATTSPPPSATKYMQVIPNITFVSKVSWLKKVLSPPNIYVAEWPIFFRGVVTKLLTVLLQPAVEKCNYRTTKVFGNYFAQSEIAWVSFLKMEGKRIKKEKNKKPFFAPFFQDSISTGMPQSFNYTVRLLLSR